jgi:hypothetical protein
MEPPQREPKTYVAYKLCLELFTNNCAKRYVQDAKREDLLAFIRKLYELGWGPRTAYNRAVIVSQLLKTNGITKLLRNRDWPEYVDRSVRSTKKRRFRRFSKRVIKTSAFSIFATFRPGFDQRLWDGNLALFIVLGLESKERFSRYGDYVRSRVDIPPG